MLFDSEATPHFSLRAVGPTGRRQSDIYCVKGVTVGGGGILFEIGP